MLDDRTCASCHGLKLAGYLYVLPRGMLKRELIGYLPMYCITLSRVRDSAPIYRDRVRGLSGEPLECRAQAFRDATKGLVINLLRSVSGRMVVRISVRGGIGDHKGQIAGAPEGGMVAPV